MDDTNLKLARWQRHTREIEHHLLWLHHHRAMWRQMTAALMLVDKDGVFADHYTQLYIAAAAMATRRLADPTGDRRTVSLALLLKDVVANPGTISRAYYIARYAHDDDPREWARSDWLEHGCAEWDESWADSNGELDIAAIEVDINRLAEAARKVTELADRTIAHIDSRGIVDSPTFEDLDHGIDTLGDVFTKYVVLITGSGLAFLEPAVQSDWQQPFRQALFESVGPHRFMPTRSDTAE